MQRLSGPPLPHQEASSSSSKAKGACLSAARTDLADDASVTGRGKVVVLLGGGGGGAGGAGGRRCCVVVVLVAVNVAVLTTKAWQSFLPDI